MPHCHSLASPVHLSVSLRPVQVKTVVTGTSRGALPPSPALHAASLRRCKRLSSECTARETLFISSSQGRKKKCVSHSVRQEPAVEPLKKKARGTASLNRTEATGNNDAERRRRRRRFFRVFIYFAQLRRRRRRKGIYFATLASSCLVSFYSLSVLCLAT